MTQESSVPGVLVALGALAATATAGVSGAVVADGWSDKVSATGVMFGVGASLPPFLESGDGTQAAGSISWAAMTAPFIEEDYRVPNYIYAGTGTTQMAKVRETAFKIWNVFLPAFVDDRSLGGVVSIAELDAFNVRGPAGPEEAEGGRFCLITWQVHIRNAY